jgi:hypothetical protein
MKLHFIDPESCVLESCIGENATVGKPNNVSCSCANYLERRCVRILHNN